MARNHKWNVHTYLTDSHQGLKSKLEVSSNKIIFLKELRKQARSRIRTVFSEAQDVFRDAKLLSPDENTQVYLRNAIKGKRSFIHVDEGILEVLVKLASNMDENQRIAFLKIRPKFRTQGSFQYKTLNAPYCKPPQEIDIDDGVYFPMQMFEDVPAIAHRLMIALVDAALRSLEFENNGWQFEEKPTCGRIRVPKESIHLDVPMYAIPEEKYVEIKDSLNAKYGLDVFSSFDESLLEEELLDKNSVLLARRDREKWQKSDPQVVQKWFTDSVKAIGEHLRLSCRFLKGWRDAQWPSGGGPSSILLMKCAVDTLGQSPLDGSDLGLVFLSIVNELPHQLMNGVESPDPSDEKLLFPGFYQHGKVQSDIVDEANELKRNFSAALNSETKAEASNILGQLFGERGVSRDLIRSVLAAPAYAQPALKSDPIEIEKTMTSG